MPFLLAKLSFEEAIQHVNAKRDPATWNLLSGLIQLSQSLVHVESTVNTMHQELGNIASHVRQIKRR